MSIRNLTTFLIVFLLTTAAEAGFSDWIKRTLIGSPKDYGTWECKECWIPKPGDPTSNEAFPDIAAFIHANNDEIHDGERIHRTTPQSSITVCNADNCLTVYYQADTDLWLPKGPATPRGTRSVKVPKQVTVTNGKRRIVVTYEGPALTVDSIVHIKVYDLAGVAPRDSSLAIRTGTVTAGPLEVAGKGSEYRKDFTDSLNREIGDNIPETIGPSEGGTPPPPSDEPKTNTNEK